MQRQEIDLATANARIEWLLCDPDMSPWLKTTLRTARQRDPIALANDLELLRCALNPWCELSIQAAASHLGAFANERR